MREIRTMFPDFINVGLITQLMLAASFQKIREALQGGPLNKFEEGLHLTPSRCQTFNAVVFKIWSTLG